MPVVIGSKPESSFGDPVGLLTDCHRRVESFLSVLVSVASEEPGAALASGPRASLENALRYFREAAPRHTADEEESLFPRLRALGRPELQPVLERVDALQRDHIRADALHAEVDRLGQEWLEAGTLAPAGAARFSLLVAELSELYGAHIAVEETEVFPAAAMLPEPQRKAMGGEMAARRNLQKI